MTPIIPIIAVGVHVFLTCLNPSGSIGFAFNAGAAAAWCLMFFRAIHCSPQEIASE